MEKATVSRLAAAMGLLLEWVNQGYVVETRETVMRDGYVVQVIDPERRGGPYVGMGHTLAGAIERARIIVEAAKHGERSGTFPCEPQSQSPSP